MSSQEPDPHCAASNVAGIWYFGKGGHFEERPLMHGSRSPLLNITDLRLSNES